ncbi:DMT family transporter [Ectopseudomonas hydrolytica]|jgi:drug/metabolite transporter (DMT)-like permease|uniref:DMT family transporter n=1 Tax=Ectopseudomonas hydrolytica TaxID=2493633 RepID=UPI0018A7C684|nr:DMT family transporter [Pseudomonas hydrolytica]MBF8161884.1 DMT family transporter [Pseudomonas mendocina]UTH30507.1 DMT family transporter [Pseudomonas hydrolytica]UZZ09661.1 DMT family transporter [Pseudomonas mendocina]
MRFDTTSLAACGSTALFVLLWSGGAIFARLGLDHASPFAFLILRFALACLALALIAAYSGTWLPERGLRWPTARAGLLMIGGYSLCYLLALDSGITPGVLATLLGVQPILTLMLLERRASPLRLVGLLLALLGLALIVGDSLLHASLPLTGVLLGLAALVCITLGAIAQKGLNQTPMRALPLQYGLCLLVSLALLPTQQWRVQFDVGLLLPLLWMGLVISVGAQLLLYRLIRAGNLVNVTSLFYLVPLVTALLDYLLLGNLLSPSAMAGMAAILLGLALVFRFAPQGR